MFTELPEECRPENFQLPVVRQIAEREWMELTNNENTTPEHYVVMEYTNSPLIAVFADLKHVEFVNMFTGKLCLPPKMFLVPTFKAMAKAMGPFIVTCQCGYTNRAYPYQFGPERSEVCNHWFINFICLFYGLGINVYTLREQYRRHANKVLNVNRHSMANADHNVTTSMYEIRQYKKSAMLYTSSEFIICRRGQE